MHVRNSQKNKTGSKSEHEIAISITSKEPQIQEPSACNQSMLRQHKKPLAHLLVFVNKVDQTSTVSVKILAEPRENLAEVDGSVMRVRFQDDTTIDVDEPSHRLVQLLGETVGMEELYWQPWATPAATIDRKVHSRLLVLSNDVVFELHGIMVPSVSNKM